MARGVVALLFLLVLTSCAHASEDDTILVLAAASLTDAFREIEVAFESANPDVDVELSLAGSASLREQILQGAPADVFASANETTMQTLVDADVIDQPQVFASNELVLAVPVRNEAGVASISDLSDDRLLVGLCAVGVPCGDFARQALDQSGVQAAVDTNERDVRSLVTKLAADELDAGLVYATDVLASDDIIGFALSPEIDVPINYPIAQVAESPNASGAAAFIDFVQSPTGQAILLSHGFTKP